jgi:DNA processing protein
MHSDSLAWLRWVLVPGLGLKRSHQLLNLIDSPQSLFLHPDRFPLPDSIKQTLREMSLLGEQHPIHRRALAQLEWTECQDNHHLIFLNDSHYPASLNHIEDAPLVLWGHGKTEVLNSTQVGIVGSRHCSSNAVRHTKSLSRELARAGIVVTSGGAKGIDTAAHEAAIEHGNTVAILGCGVDVCYPKANRALFTSIVDNGLLLSEYPLGTLPKPGHFPRRNRLISALSDVIAVIEAAEKSGSLITAMHALEQGKDIFAMPGDIGNPNSAGSHRLIQEGAYLLTQSADILEHLGWQSPSAVSGNTELNVQALTPLQAQIVRVLQCEALPLDALAHDLQLGVHQLLEPLLELELNGVIEQLPGGYTLCDIA